MNEKEKKALENLLKRNPNPLEEDQVKELLRRDLEGQGWHVTVKWGQEKGIGGFGSGSPIWPNAARGYPAYS